MYRGNKTVEDYMYYNVIMLVTICKEFTPTLVIV